MQSRLEALCAELAGYVAGRCAEAWLTAHGRGGEVRTLEEDAALARADIEARAREALDADEEAREVAALGAAGDAFEMAGPVLRADLAELTATVDLDWGEPTTVPVSFAMARAGFRCGDRLRVRVEGAGR